MCVIEGTTLTVPVLKELLTQAQYRSIGITSVGFSVKEAADMTYSSENTVQTHIKDAKDIIDAANEVAQDKCTQRLSRSELRFAFVCQFLGHDPQEIRKRILATILSIAVILTISASINTADRRRTRLTVRRARFECTEFNYISLV